MHQSRCGTATGNGRSQHCRVGPGTVDAGKLTVCFFCPPYIDCQFVCRLLLLLLLCLQCAVSFVEFFHHRHPPFSTTRYCTAVRSAYPMYSIHRTEYRITNRIALVVMYLFMLQCISDDSAPDDKNILRIMYVFKLHSCIHSSDGLLPCCITNCSYRGSRATN